MVDVPAPVVLKFKSADGEIFEAEEDVASVSLLLKGMLEDIRVENDEGKRLMETIPTLPVDGKNMKWALVYCEHYKNIPYVEEDPRTIQKNPLTDWDKEFFNQIPDSDLPQFLETAYHLEIPGLVKIIASRIAQYLETLTLEEMRACFGVENDFSEEEWKEVNERFNWLGLSESPKKKNENQKLEKKWML